MINWLLKQPFNLYSIHLRILKRVTLKKFINGVSRQVMINLKRCVLASLSGRMRPLVGSVAEWSIALVLKTSKGKPFVSSNLTASASFHSSVQFPGTFDRRS